MTTRRGWGPSLASWRPPGSRRPPLPLGLAGLHVSDLTGWDGTADTPELKGFMDRLTDLCGPPRLMSIEPDEVHIVLGRPKAHPNAGAMLNLVCRLVPHVDRTVTLQWMQGRLIGPGVAYDMTWHLIFDTDGPLEHVRKVAESTAVTLMPEGTRQGIQLSAPAFGAGATWPKGDYMLELRGWANRGFAEGGHNTETSLSLHLSDQDAGWVCALAGCDGRDVGRRQAHGRRDRHSLPDRPARVWCGRLKAEEIAAQRRRRLQPVVAADGRECGETETNGDRAEPVNCSASAPTG